MEETQLNKETILHTAETVYRKYGPEKATVIDVARALNISHGTVYRYFSSKAALKEAVTERWLLSISDPLIDIVNQSSHATIRLRQWFDKLMEMKRNYVLEDPELFTMYSKLTEESVEAVNNHVDTLVNQITQIIQDGMYAKEFKPGNAADTANSLFLATVTFHSPIHSKEWSSPTINQKFDGVWNLILSGLRK